jgi:beta-lactam-binding protein with PASTA domain
MDHNLKPNKSFIDNLAPEKPESFEEEVFVKQKKNYIPTIIVTLVILIVGSVLFTTFTKGSTMPDMTGWTENDAYNWAKTNNATIVRKDIYSLTHENGMLISQLESEGTKINRNGAINLTFSKGADPNELIAFPDLKEMTLQQVNQWINDNKLAGVYIVKENSTVFEKDTVINYELIDGSESSFIRKNRLKIYISLGSKEMSETVVVPDFSGKTKGDIVKWAKDNSIEVSYQEQFDDYVAYGQVVTQSIASQTKMKRTDPLEVTISLGKEITVPSFVGITRNEATNLATLYGITIHFTAQVSTKESGTILDQDIAPSTSIHEKQLLTLTVATTSETVVIPNFVGLSSSEASALAGLHGISTFTVTADSTEKAGQIISQSVSVGSRLSKSDYITLTVSSGDLLIPDFTQLTRNEADVVAREQGISIQYNEVKTVEYDNHTIISQNKASGSAIPSTTTVILDVTVNSGVTVPDFSTMSKTEAEIWASNHSVQLSIIEEYSDTYEAGLFYNQNYKHQILPSDESLLVYRSLGKLGITDYTDQKKLDIINWQTDVNLKGASVTLEFIVVEDSIKPKGTITDQSIKSDTIILNQHITVWVSGNEQTVTVPDFSAVQESTLIAWCNNNQVNYIIEDRYSDDYVEGILFGQNYKNTSIPAGDKLIIYRSIGKLRIGNFVGKTKAEIEGFFNDANLKGANLEVVYGSKTSYSIPKGNILEQSVMSNYIQLGSKVSIILSAGKEVQMPELTGRSVDQAIELLESLDMEYSISYEYSEIHNGKALYSMNTVMSQSVKERSLVSQSKVIVIVVSLGADV